MLLGAYSLDAVDGDEAQIIERHLTECSRCSAEVSDCREIAGVLGGGYLPAPVPLWDRIATNLGEPPVAAMVKLPLRRLHFRLGVAAASVAAIALAALGVRVVDQDRRIGSTQTALQDRAVQAAALAARGDPAARRTDLRSGDGRVLAHAVLTRDGSGYLWSGGLPSLEAARTYQLWAVIGNEPISAALLGPRPVVVPFRISGEVIGLAITEEDAGGVVASQNPRLVSGLVQEA